MMSGIFRWGLIGPGQIAERFAESIDAVDGAVLHAVASRNGERAKAFANRFKAEKAYGNYGDLYADPAIDAVYICTPHRFHAEQAAACLLAGKPVLCEKPLTVNAKESNHLFALAQQQQVFLMEAMWSPFLPVYQQVKQWLDEHRIGDIRMMQSSFGFAMDRDPSGRWLNPELAGGVLLDMGVYNVSISQWLMNRMPNKIQAVGYIGDTGVDEMVAVNLDYGDGVVSQFQCQFQSQLSNDFWIYGSQGRIQIEPFFWDNGGVQLITQEQQETRLQLPFRARGFEYQIEHAMDCIRSGKIASDVISFDHTRATMEIMDMIRAQINLRYSFE